MSAVRVIRDPETIRLLADLARRQLIRYISKHPMTQTELASATRLTEPSVSHHLQILLKAGLIKIQRVEPGARGAVKKYYEPTALLFVEDWDSTPPTQRRYFIHAHLERLRGMLSVIHLKQRGLTFTTDELEELAESIASRVSTVAERHEGDYYVGDREQLMIGIYSETLERVMMEERWRGFFEPLIASSA